MPFAKKPSNMIGLSSARAASGEDRSEGEGVRAKRVQERARERIGSEAHIVQMAAVCPAGPLPMMQTFVLSGAAMVAAVEKARTF
jgi:hypothetical protein